MTTQALKPANELAKLAANPFPGESNAYRIAHRALLAEEVEFRRRMTRLAAQRQALPPSPFIEKNYRFRDANGSDAVRLFWSSAMTLPMADPGQDPRDAPDIASLWNILDLTPNGRRTDGYSKRVYSQ